MTNPNTPLKPVAASSTKAMKAKTRTPLKFLSLTMRRLTYVFEDNWPKYGDFDLNDIVLTISNRSVQANASGNLKSAKLDIALKAVGASKVLGVGSPLLRPAENITPRNSPLKA